MVQRFKNLINPFVQPNIKVGVNASVNDNAGPIGAAIVGLGISVATGMLLPGAPLALGAGDSAIASAPASGFITRHHKKHVRRPPNPLLAPRANSVLPSS